MDKSFLDVNASYVNESSIQEMFVHSYLPFSTSAPDNGIDLPSDSFIYLDGKIIRPADMKSEINIT